VKKRAIREGSLLLARILPGGMLLIAGFSKAVGPAEEFAALLEAYRLFPSFALKPMSLGLPFLEMWVGLFLICGYGLRWSAGAAVGFYASFVVSLLFTFLRGIDLVSCGCFGMWGQVPPAVTLGIDVVMLVLCAGLVRFPSAFLTLDAWIRRRT